MLDPAIKQEIRYRLRNHRIWDEQALEGVFDIVEKIQSGALSVNDWFIPNVVMYEEYFLHLGLTHLGEKKRIWPP